MKHPRTPRRAAPPIALSGALAAALVAGALGAVPVHAHEGRTTDEGRWPQRS